MNAITVKYVDFVPNKLVKLEDADSFKDTIFVFSNKNENQVNAGLIRKCGSEYCFFPAGPIDKKWVGITQQTMGIITTFLKSLNEEYLIFNSEEGSIQRHIE